jgi:D-alanyl-D-alanine carboxypeptidase (penicillin-binding protein 5/6)
VPSDDASPTAASARERTHGARPVALGWVRTDAGATGTGSTRPLQNDPQNEPANDPLRVLASLDLLDHRPRRSAGRSAAVVPVVIALLIAITYCAVTLLWPLTAVPPRASAVAVTSSAAPTAAIAWPRSGSAAVAVEGFTGSAASTADSSAIASITKLVTALTVLDQLPLKVGEQGPAFRFTSADRSTYRQYLARNESALNVPVGGTLSEFQLLEGMLIGSGSNYATRLVDSIWPSDAVFASAADAWLRQNGISGITIVEPTGFDHRNVAPPAALLTLAGKALQNPVIAQIVAMPAVDLPGAGHVPNTNDLVGKDGVIGIKTGTLVGYDLLAAARTAVGGATVTMFAVTLVQPDDATRDATIRSLFDQLRGELTPTRTVASGTVVGHVRTRWGDDVAITTAADADVVLWNGSRAKVSSTFTLGSHSAKGARVGTLTATGPVDGATVPLVLARAIGAPSPWWRLTHPLVLFGLG